jgi:quinoprotein glucose dehydrogenase
MTWPSATLKPGIRLMSFALALALTACQHPSGKVTAPAGEAPSNGWPVYGGSGRSDRYSELTQIDRNNVAMLKPAWRFDMTEPGDTQTNPIVVGSMLYAYAPDQKVIALDAASGRMVWTFDPGVRGSGPARGLAYWTDGKESRLLAGVMNWLIALDPATGNPEPDFGDHGRIDLRRNLSGDYATYYVALTSPGIVYKDLVIVGFRTNEVAPAAPGDIRAYDVHTGALRWSFHTIPHDGEYGSATWPAGAWKTGSAANDWVGFSLDDARGIVYAPTGSAASDFYGADRVGDDLFANSLLALDANTGKRLWHFQSVHHDLWDRDFSSQPSLVTINHNGRRIDALAQPTKQGYLYVFDRVTGEPVFPIEEQPFPASDVPGERASPTQPVSATPAAYARQLLTEDMLTHRTPAAHEWAVSRFRDFRSAGQFVPLSVGQETVIFPGFDGGAEWGGAAVDPRAGVIYINSNDVAWTGMLIKSTPGMGLGASVYQANCSACHAADRKGAPPAFPSLVDASRRLTPEQIAAVIHSGRGRMPPFPGIESFSLSALLRYVTTGQDAIAAADNTGSDRGANAKQEMSASLFKEDRRSQYVFNGYNKFLDPDGYPAVAPPWGTLNAIDLNTGRYLWKIPLGEYLELVAQGIGPTGSENYGGPIVTAGGLLFIGATIFDHKFRALDSRTGELLWEADLPYAGTATPATYIVDGKQYVVIYTNNARNKAAPQGSAYVAFALP